MNRHSFTGSDPMSEQAVEKSRVPNTSNRVLVVSKICAVGYQRLDWALEVDGSDTEKGRIPLIP